MVVAEGTRLREQRVRAPPILRHAATVLQIDREVESPAAGSPRTWYRTELEHDGTTFHVRCPFAGRPAPGTNVLVLFHPGIRYALAFSNLAKPSVCRLDRD